jgi:hypothetical protein
MRSRRSILMVAMALAAWTAGGGVRRPADRLALAQEQTATLTVQVVFRWLEGVDAASNEPVRVVERPVAGAEVWAVPAGEGSATPVATLITDEMGTAVAELVPGSYWLLVPLREPRAPGVVSIARGESLPDGTRVLGWTSVELERGIPASTTIILPLPG